MSARTLIRHLRSLSLPDIEAHLGRDHVVRRAQEYVEDGRVEEIWVDGNALRAHVSGSSSTPYHCVVRLQEGELEPQCSCPFTRGTCWHVGAVLMTLAYDPELLDKLEQQVARRPAKAGRRTAGGAAGAGAEEEGDEAEAEVPQAPDPERLEALRAALLARPKERLVAELVDLAAHDAALAAHLEEGTPEPADLDLRLYRQAARAALRPGVPLRRFEVARVAGDVRTLTTSIGRLVAGGHPEQALDLLAEIAAMAWRRIEESDDQDGILVALVRDTLREWASGWAEVPGRDRQKLARALFGWILEDAGGVFAGLVGEAAEALGDIGLDTLRNLLVSLHEERLRARRGDLAAGEEVFVDPLLSSIRRALRETAEARRDLDDFLAFCDPDGRHGGEVLAAARQFARAGNHLEALRWAEQGRRRARGTERMAIDDLRIQLLVRLERRREAIELAWEAFRSEPSAAGLRRLLGVVAPSERAEWRVRAIDLCEAAADASAFVEVCLAANAADRLVERLEEAPSFVLAASAGTLDSACLSLDEQAPGAAARIRLHLAERLLAAGDPRFYPRARAHLEQAQRAAERRGDRELFLSALGRLRAAHAVVRAWWPEEPEPPTGARSERR